MSVSRLPDTWRTEGCSGRCWRHDAHDAASHEAFGRQRAIPANVTIGPLSWDVRLRQLRLDGRPIRLSAQETDLVAYLLADGGHTVYTKQEILVQVWGEAYGDLTPSRSPGTLNEPLEWRMLRTAVHRLRHKFGRHTALIQTHLSYGYAISDRDFPSMGAVVRPGRAIGSLQWFVLRTLHTRGGWTTLRDLARACKQTHWQRPNYHYCSSSLGDAIRRMEQRRVAIEVRYTPGGRIEEVRWTGAAEDAP